MKNATAYEKKMKKLLGGMSKGKSIPTLKDDPFTFLIQSILEADVPRRAAAGVVSEINAEFVDYNDLRVAPVKDVTDCMPRDFYGQREKAESILKTLNAIFSHSSSLSLEYLQKMPKRDLRKHLQEIGMGAYASALTTMVIFGGHAVPVDRTLAYILENEECIAPASDIADIQGFLERIIPQKDGWAAHECLRDHVEKNLKSILKRRKEDDAIAAAAAAAAPPAPKPVLPIIPVPLAKEPEFVDEDEETGGDEGPAAPAVKAKHTRGRPAKHAKGGKK